MGGKTYTMYGDSKPDKMGIIPQCAQYLFDRLNKSEEIDTFKVTVSFLEIYQERIRDLLVNNKSKNQNLGIKLNENKQEYVHGLSEREVYSTKQILELIQNALANRATDSTKMNAVSSRSHMLMQMSVNIKLNDGSLRMATGNFVDLAGSERVKKTEATGS